MIVARPSYAALGGLLLITGLVGLVAIGVASFGTCPACQVWGLRLGLGLGVLLSGLAQGVALVGGWLVWVSRRPAGDRAQGPCLAPRHPDWTADDAPEDRRRGGVTECADRAAPRGRKPE